MDDRTMQSVVDVRLVVEHNGGADLERELPLLFTSALDGVRMLRGDDALGEPSAAIKSVESAKLVVDEPAEHVGSVETRAFEAAEAIGQVLDTLRARGAPGSEYLATTALVEFFEAVGHERRLQRERREERKRRFEGFLSEAGMFGLRGPRIPTPSPEMSTMVRLEHLDELPLPPRAFPPMPLMPLVTDIKDGLKVFMGLRDAPRTAEHVRACLAECGMVRSEEWVTRWLELFVENGMAEEVDVRPGGRRAWRRGSSL